MPRTARGTQRGSKILRSASDSYARLISLLSVCIASGLDSSTAYTIVSLLKRLAVTRGRTIILTIHSPSTKIFSLFDRVLLLTQYKNGARLAYQGAASEVLSYFESKLDLGVAKVQKLCGRTNARLTMADYLAALLQRRRKSQNGDSEEQGPAAAAPSAADEQAGLSDGGGATDSADDDERIDAIVRTYGENEDRMTEQLQEMASAAALTPDGRSVGAFFPGSSDALSWLRQFQLLTVRNYMTTMRQLTHLRARVFTNVFLAIFVGLLYYSPSRDLSSSNYNQTAIFNRVGFIFFVTCMQALITLVNAVLTCK